MIRKKVGFIGSGYMGFGMAKNLIKNFDVYVIAHKNRDPINKLVNLGAKETLNYNDLLNNNLDCLMMCVSNTPVAVSVAEMIAPIIKEKLLIIDLTTHDKLGTTKMQNIFHSKKITYTVNPVMGGTCPE
jgi:3-hydroxyisobutyrate dehydrogenase-like beta-hydroxyacid dehydrogenase